MNLQLNSFAMIFVLVLLFIVGAAIIFFITRARYSSANWGSYFRNCLAGFVCWLVHKYHRQPYEYMNLPERGGAIVVSNHSSGLDPLILIACSRRPLRFLIAREQYERFGLTWVFRKAGCIPVERDKNPHNALRAAIRAVNAGEAVALFPHGKIHRDIDPPIKIKGGAIKLAEYTGCEIFPVRIDGVRAQGHVFLSLLARASVKLTFFPSMLCHPDGMYNNIVELQEKIEAKNVQYKN